MMKWVHTRGFGSFLGPRCPLPVRCVSIFVMRLASLSSQGEIICVAGSISPRVGRAGHGSKAQTWLEREMKGKGKEEEKVGRKPSPPGSPPGR